MREQPPCPECEKLVGVSERSQYIGFFLEWMSNQGIVLAKWDNNFTGTIQDLDGNEEDFSGCLVPAHEFKGDSGINKLLARYFGIDLDKVEEERRALLQWLRERNNESL